MKKFNIFDLLLFRLSPENVLLLKVTYTSKSGWTLEIWISSVKNQNDTLTCRWIIPFNIIRWNKNFSGVSNKMLKIWIHRIKLWNSIAFPLSSFLHLPRNLYLSTVLVLAWILLWSNLQTLKIVTNFCYKICFVKTTIHFFKYRYMV